MQVDLFEWDDQKATINLKKHGVSFEEASTIFDDPYVLIESDGTSSFEELRAQATGFSARSRVLLVVYTERTERIRLISARRASPDERRKYESQFE